MLGDLALLKIKKDRKRVGRGGSRGKTSGRGMKGQLARSGGRSEIKPFFEGGQMSLTRRIPRRGFISRDKKNYQVVSLSAIERLLPGNSEVSLMDLQSVGLISTSKSKKNLVKILSGDKLVKPFKVSAHAISKSAKACLESVGGTFELVGDV